MAMKELGKRICGLILRDAQTRSGIRDWALCGLKDVGKREMGTLAWEEILVPEKETAGMRTVMIMHGLLGSGRNWRSFAKRLASNAMQSCPPSFPGWRMILVDLRNHGNSAGLQGFEAPHDIPAAAKDLVDLIKSQSWDWPEVLIAHSLGGKVALEFGQKSASHHYSNTVPPKQLWILDSVPGKVSIKDSEGEVERVLSTLEALPNPIPSRRWLQDQMLELGFSKGLSDWLGSNLKRISASSEEMKWVFNVPGAKDMFISYRDLDCWSVLENPPEEMEIAIVRARQSDRWTNDIIWRLEDIVKRNALGKVSYHILENAGHWVHVDNPDGLLNIITPSLVKLSG